MDQGLPSAQTLLSPNEFEEAQVRLELERIIAEDPLTASAARNALDALDQPASTRVGRQARNRRERGQRRIVNGIPTALYPAVGALLRGGNRRTAKAWCTGTLVGCDKFLTAAHCIAQNPSAKDYQVFFPQLGFFQVKEIKWPKEDYRDSYFDLAMLTLSRAIEGVAPISINTNVNAKPPNGFMGTIVGFGRTGGSRYDSGIKREGTIKTRACPAGHNNPKLICWSFDADIKANTSASNTCFGDSGGAVFMRDTDAGGRNVLKVFGVVSGGSNSNCVSDDLSVNVDVGQFGKWIQIAGEDRLSSQICGNPVLTGTLQTKNDLLRISETNPEVAIRLDVPPNIAAFRVAMNGEDNSFGNNDFDLLVFQGDRVQGAPPICEENGSGQFAFCNFEAPVSGFWTIVVTQKKGDGNAQITTTFVAASGR